MGKRWMSESYVSAGQSFFLSSSPQRGFGRTFMDPDTLAVLMLRLSVAKRPAEDRARPRGGVRGGFRVLPQPIFPDDTSLQCLLRLQLPTPHIPAPYDLLSPQSILTVCGYRWSFAQGMLASASIAFVGWICGERASSLVSRPEHVPHRHTSHFTQESVLLASDNHFLKGAAEGAGGTRQHGQGPVIFKGEEQY